MEALNEFQAGKENSLKHFWRWLWHSDSILSWIVSLIIAFIIVKFVFFPVLSLIFATQLPLVVIESSSMHHPGNFLGNIIQDYGTFDNWWKLSGNWYQERSITEKQAENWPLRTGLEKGDIVIVYGRGEPKVGDIIIFNAYQAHPIIHRIVSIKQVNGTKIYSTKGDNNSDQLTIEKEIPKDAIIGKAVYRIPKLGWAKLIFVDIFNIFSS